MNMSTHFYVSIFPDHEVESMVKILWFVLSSMGSVAFYTYPFRVYHGNFRYCWLLCRGKVDPPTTWLASFLVLVAAWLSSCELLQVFTRISTQSWFGEFLGFSYCTGVECQLTWPPTGLWLDGGMPECSLGQPPPQPLSGPGYWVWLRCWMSVWEQYYWCWSLYMDREGD